MNPQEQQQSPLPPAPEPTPSPEPPQFTPSSTEPQQPPMITPEKPNKLRQILPRIVVALITLFLIGGGYVLLKDTLFTGSKVSESDLVSETIDDISFSRPKDWGLIEEAGFKAMYTEDQKAIEEADQAVGVLSESIGVNYDDLSAEEITQVKDYLSETYSELSLEGDGCLESTAPTIKEMTQSNYSLAYSIEVECLKYEKRNVQATLKMVVGVRQEKMHGIAVIAINETWQKSGPALQAMLDSLTAVE